MCKDIIAVMTEKTTDGLVLSSQEIEHIAELARLRLTPAEKELYRRQLSAILEYAERLGAVVTAGIPPTSSVLPARTELRQDQSRPGLDRQALLGNAAETEEDQFRVPPVLE